MGPENSPGPSLNCPHFGAASLAARLGPSANRPLERYAFLLCPFFPLPLRSGMSKIALELAGRIERQREVWKGQGIQHSPHFQHRAVGDVVSLINSGARRMTVDRADDAFRDIVSVHQGGQRVPKAGERFAAIRGMADLPQHGVVDPLGHGSPRATLGLGQSWEQVACSARANVGKVAFGAEIQYQLGDRDPVHRIFRFDPQDDRMDETAWRRQWEARGSSL